MPPGSDEGSAGPNPQVGYSSLLGAGPNKLKRFLDKSGYFIRLLKLPHYDRVFVLLLILTLPGFKSMKSTTFSPSLTAPKSSTTRGEFRVLHVLTSSLLN